LGVLSGLNRHGFDAAPFAVRKDVDMPKKIDAPVKERALRMFADHRQDYPSDTALAEAVGKKLGIGRETARRWLVQADINAGARPGASTDEQAEIKKLRAENRRLREDNEILRAATVFFAGELDPRNR
jgi:transposase